MNDKVLRPNRIKDISGKRYGRLVVVGVNGRTKCGKVLWECKCDCGNTTLATKDHLGKCTNSCGCLKKEVSRNRWTKHGDKHSRLYNLWCSMRQRCGESGVEKEAYYERGIRVCEEWNDYTKFRDWAMSHGYDPNAKRGVTTIDRIDNDKGYSPDNCRFVTQTENARNKRNNHIIVVDGEHLCLNEAAQKYGINNGTLAGRISRGWNPEDAVKIPVRKGRYRNGRQE